MDRCGIGGRTPPFFSAHPLSLAQRARRDRAGDVFPVARLPQYRTVFRDG